MYVGNDPVNFVDPSGLDWKDAVCGNQVARAIGSFLGFFGDDPRLGQKALAFTGGTLLIRGVLTLTTGKEFFHNYRLLGKISPFKGALILTAAATAYNLGCQAAGY